MCGLLLGMTACTEEHLAQDSATETEVVAAIEASASEICVFGGDASSAATRTYIYEGDGTGSTVATMWRPNEVIGVYGSYAKNTKFTGTNDEDAGSVSFRGFMLGTPKYAYYPYSEANDGVAATAVKGNMPAYQEYSTVYKDIVGDYRAGVLDSRNWYSSTFTFSRLVSILKFVVDATGTPLENSSIRTISMRVNNQRQLAGDFTINLETQAVTLADYAAGCDSLILRWTNEPALLSDRSYVAYRTALPCVQTGDEATFTITTNTHIATITRTLKVDFAANGLYNFNLILANFPDMEVEEISRPVPDETPSDDPLAGLTDATPALNSFRFTVADNPGRILGRKFSHNSSFTVSTSTVTEEACTIDTENGKIILNLPYLNDRRLVPTFEIPEGTALVYEGGVIVSGETEVDFSQYRQVAVVNGNEEALLFDIEFTNTGLPVVVINQETGTTSSESNSEYSKASAAWYAATGTKWQPKSSDWEMTSGVDNFMIYNPDGTSALVDKNGAVVEAAIDASTRIRGNVTQQMPKKPFAVKLDKKHGFSITKADGAQVDFPAHKRWVLLANWKDRTLMRNAVAFGIADVFRNTLSDGIAWNPSGQFVELVYNGVHVGTYYLCEQIKIDGNRLDIKEPYDADDAFTSVGDYGYLLESDDGYDETWQFTTANYVPFLFKDDGNDAMLEYAAGFVRGIEDNLYAGNYTAAYANMDLTSFVDFWLIQELMMNSETGHPKSCYSYINDGKIYAGPIWDFDWNTLPVSKSYSENGYEFGKSMLEDAVPSSGWFGSKSYQCYHKSSGYPSAPLEESDANYLWYPMLVKDATFTALAAERWNAVKGAVQAYVDTQIPVLKAEVAASEAVNNAMWPVDSKTSSWSSKRSSTYGIGGGFCGDEGKSFSEAVSTLQSTLTTRINGMSYVSDQNWPSVTYGSK